MAEATVRLDIQGLDELRAKAAGYQTVYQQEMTRAMQQAVLHVQSIIARYPRQPPESRYRRTGLLGRSWTTQVRQETDSLLGLVGNRVEYAPAVQGPAGVQRPFFGFRRWLRIDQSLEQAQPQIVAFLQVGVNRVAARLATR